MSDIFNKKLMEHMIDERCFLRGCPAFVSLVLWGRTQVDEGDENGAINI